MGAVRGELVDACLQRQPRAVLPQMNVIVDNVLALLSAHPGRLPFLAGRGPAM
jgi:hypothetical protein